MHSHSLSPIVAEPATGPGALAGYSSRCTCGLVMRSSLVSALEADRVAHRAYHDRQVERASDVAYVRQQLAEAIAARMILGESYDDATAEAFAYCDRRWPTVTAALIAEARS